MLSSFYLSYLCKAEEEPLSILTPAIIGEFVDILLALDTWH